MKVILLQDVKSLGKRGEIVTVSDGYARNMLLPKKLAAEANAKNLNTLKLQNAHEEKVAQENLAAAQELAGKVGGAKVTVTVKVGEEGRVFGSVSAKEIADAAKAQCGLDLDKKKIQMDGPIKEIGEKQVTVKLHPQVAANLTVDVQAEA